MHNLVGKKNTKTKFSKLKVKIYYQRVKTSSDPCAEYSAMKLNVCVWLLPAFTLDDMRNRSIDSSLALNVASPS